MFSVLPDRSIRVASRVAKRFNPTPQASLLYNKRQPRFPVPISTTNISTSITTSARSSAPLPSNIRTMAESSDQTPWWASFPTPSHTAPILQASEALSQLSSPELLLVDVRRNDFEGGTIKGSLNLPAQSFYQNRAALYDLCKRAGVKRVAFYCGSSNGRAPRCSGWFGDYIAEHGDGSAVQALTLAGGIKGWVKAGSAYVTQMEGYDGEHWKSVGIDAPSSVQAGLEASKNT